MSEIGQTIREFRISKGMSQTQMAAILQCSQPQISLWEAGKFTPSKMRTEFIIEQLKKFEIINKFDIDIDGNIHDRLDKII